MASAACHRDGAHDLSCELVRVDGTPLDYVEYTNGQGDGFRWVPDRFVVRLGPASDAIPLESLDLRLPSGWRALPLREEGTWLVFPSGRPHFPVSLQVLDRRAEPRARVIALRALPVVFRGCSRFHPRLHRLPWANRVEDLGVVEAGWEHFRATFRFALAPRALFAGLYREVVGLRQLPDGRVRGGLCTGLSRTALAQALACLDERTSLRDTVLVLHGRQLSDRALLAGLPWFLFPSPRRAYQRFVDDLLDCGTSDRCFDLNVPRPWRRDVVRALLGQGHTVVPYAFSQAETGWASVWVYDPNLPDRAEETVVTIDLERDRYEYPPLAVDGRRTTIVAVPLTAYLRGRTAVLAGMANLLLAAPRRLLVAAGLVTMLVLAWLIAGRNAPDRRTRPDRPGRSLCDRTRRFRGASRSAEAAVASAWRR